MDPLTTFPLEVSLAILEYLELEEMLLSTRFTSRAWNAMIYSQVAHLMVSSYSLRIEFDTMRLDIPLRLRHDDAAGAGYTVHGGTSVKRQLCHQEEFRYSPISAGIVNRNVNRAFMSNQARPNLAPIEPFVPSTVKDPLRYLGTLPRAQISSISYTNPFTNTGALDTIGLDLLVLPVLDRDCHASMTIQVTCTMHSLELAKWIVLCRLAQGYQTPAEIQEKRMQDRKLGLNGVTRPYRPYKNSGGIWGSPPKRIGAR